jgi:pyridoxamine 5'-phosphate oxidase
MTTPEHFAQFRRDYSGAPLDTSTVSADPFDQFKHWFDDAVTANVNEPNAMTVATSDNRGTPSCRVVLLKSCDHNGFTFFTNYNSRKGYDIAVNPQAALLFFWKELNRQIRISGHVLTLSTEESDAYFRSRPVRAQIAAIVSPQSRIIENRMILERQFESIASQIDAASPERPSHWGGYRVVPEEYEFWQGKPDRLHDRIHYRNSGNSWIIERLAP